MTFTEYAASKGIEVLKEDITHLNNHLIFYRNNKRAAIMKRYVEIWVTVADNCESRVKAQNEGRRAANLWVLGGCDAN